MFSFDRDEKRIRELEQEILECEKIFNEADYNYRENYNPQDALLWDHEVAEAKNHLKIVSLERGFLLERRDSWKNKVYWGVLVSGSIYLIFDLIKWLLGLIVKIT